MCSRIHGWDLALIQRPDSITYVHVRVCRGTRVGFSCLHVGALETASVTWAIPIGVAGTTLVLWEFYVGQQDAVRHLK